jgi:NAD(P)-dependent dehydrogenase (short-subunit alcohol dehydrogenase family)
VLGANVTSALLLAQAFRDARVTKVDATLVLISSVMATVGQPGVAVYAASKGAISAVTRSLALELIRDGIRVNAIEAGIVSTALTDGIRSAVGATAFEAIADAHPLGLGSPDDVARPALFLSSPASAWMTGSSLVVDGGYTSR